MPSAEFVTLLFIVLDVAVALSAVLSGLYIWWVYRQRTEDALFLTRLVHRNVRVSAASAGILAYLVLAISGHGLGTPWGAVVISVLVIAMMIGPVTDALLWFHERGGSLRGLLRKLIGRGA